MEVGLGPGDIVLDEDDPVPQGKGHSSTLTFRPMSIVAKRSPISVTAELFFQLVLRAARVCNVGVLRLNA